MHKKVMAEQTQAPPPPPPLLQAPLFPGQRTISQDEAKAFQHVSSFSTVVDAATKAYDSLTDYINANDKHHKLQCLSYYVPVKPIIQNGPLCGLVALAMAAELINSKKETCLSTEAIFDLAKASNYSIQGEMFSALYLSKLAQTLLGGEISLCVTSPKIQESVSEIIEHLIQGHFILIPYDADKNHSPCLKRGHKAHWALISGFFIAGKERIVSHEQDDSEYPFTILTLEDLKDLTEKKKKLIVKNAECVFIYAHQGKSKYAGIWSLQALVESNKNLVEIGAEREGDCYIVPPGGIESGLKDQYILLKHR